MYRVHVFAGLAERLGCRQVELNLPATHLSLQQLRSALSDQFPHARAEIMSAIVALNQAYAQDASVVQPSDEIALIPPVGGGSDEPQYLVRVSDTELDISAAYKALSNPHNGGIVLFCGTVREWTQDRRTTHLSYEAYRPMALRQMDRIAAEAAHAYPSVTTLQWHRIGDLLPEDIAVICAAASPHRNDAFEVARTLIERLKKEVPIWKKEYYVDGEVTWQANPE